MLSPFKVKINGEELYWEMLINHVGFLDMPFIVEDDAPVSS